MGSGEAVGQQVGLYGGKTAGDTEPRVQEARAAAQRALEAPSKGQLEKSAPPSKGQRAPDIEEMLKKGAVLQL